MANAKIQDFKVAAIGESSVGKTSVINRFYFGSFNPNTPATIGNQYVNQNVDIRGTRIQLKLWDTAGQEKYSNMLPFYIRDASCILIFFDLSNKEALAGIEKYQRIVSENVDPKIPVVIVGNKSDLVEPGFFPENISSYCNSSNIQYYTTSAKTGDGVDDLFTAVGTLCLQTNSVVRPIIQRVEYEQQHQNDTSGCC